LSLYAKGVTTGEISAHFAQLYGTERACRKWSATSGRTRVCRRAFHLTRNTFGLTSRKYWDEIRRDIKPIYTAVNATAARSAFDGSFPQ
jgi:transposase-like protein